MWISHTCRISIYIPFRFFLDYFTRLNSNGDIDFSFNVGGYGFNNEVYAIAIQDDGKILVGGNFTAYSGVSKNYIVRLNTDGTIDTTFNPPYSYYRFPYTLETLQNGDIIMGGEILLNNLVTDYSWNYIYNGDGEINIYGAIWEFTGPNDDSGNGWTTLTVSGSSFSSSPYSIVTTDASGNLQASRPSDKKQKTKNPHRVNDEGL